MSAAPMKGAAARTAIFCRCGGWPILSDGPVRRLPPADGRRGFFFAADDNCTGSASYPELTVPATVDGMEVPRLGYQQYGIRPELVERVKRKMKHPAAKERMKALLEGVTKHDLQDRAKVRRLVRQAAAILNEPLTSELEERIVAFVIAQRIDPNNTLHLLRLWSMFR
jgi:hypothetical protein